jgi:hypothetical protein
MNVACEFEFFEDYACCRPSGHVSFREAVLIISKAISLAAEREISRLMVDTTNLVGFPVPTTVERYFMASTWASTGRGLRFALVVLPEMIDPYRFGVVVARNRGLYADVFTSEPEAIVWVSLSNPQ